MFKKYPEKISRRLWRHIKVLMYTARKPCNETLPIFIMGCGRSGTTMMINIFHRDHRVLALNENDPKIARDYMLDFNKIPNAIIASKASVLVMKPILNSFDALYLLKTYHKSKVLWMIRDYKDMVASSMKKFNTTVSGYMKDLVLEGRGNNWLSNGIPRETLEIISSLDIANLSPLDWVALVWWSVNRTVILNRLFEFERFFLVNYETMVSNPESTLKSVFDFVGLKYKKKTIKYIHAASIGKGAHIELHPQVEALCQDLTSVLIL